MRVFYLGRYGGTTLLKGVSKFHFCYQPVGILPLLLLRLPNLIDKDGAVTGAPTAGGPPPGSGASHVLREACGALLEGVSRSVP